MCVRQREMERPRKMMGDRPKASGEDAKRGVCVHACTIEKLVVCIKRGVCVGVKDSHIS
jgi:hypothetical protein